MAFDWNQFKPFDQGGIVATDSGRTIDQPAVDKTQGPFAPVPWFADPSNPDRQTTQPVIPSNDGSKFGGGNNGIFFDPGPNTPSNPFYNNTGVFGGGTPPGLWNPGASGVQWPPKPTIDPSRYDPNLTYDDYYRDYHAPDREAVLRGVPNQPVYRTQGQIPGSYMPDSGYRPSSDYGTLNQLAQQFKDIHMGGGGFGNPFGGVGRALTGGGKSVAGALGFGGGGASGTVRVRTPEGKEVSVPANQLQEALRRGARQIG